MAKGGGKRPSPGGQGGWQGRNQHGGGPSGSGYGQGPRQGSGQGRPGGYGKPGYGKPSHGKPGFDKPGYDKPGYDKPGYGTSGQGKPSYGKPSYGKPSYGKPSYGKPGYGKPGNDKPGSDKPGYGRPAYDRPAYDKNNQGRPQQGRPSFGRPYGERDDRKDPRREQQPYRRDNRYPDRAEPSHRPAPAYREEPVEQPQQVAPENLLVGRNPIREALKAGRHFESLYVVKGEQNGSAREIVRKAKEQRVVIKEVDRRALDAMSPGHQGLIAVVSAHQYATIEDMLALAKERGQEPLIVLLDGITDPHNFGAIARSAECCGAHGVIVCERRAVGMTPGAAKAAAGAFEYLPIARVANVSRTIDQLKEAGLWIYAADQQGAGAHYRADLAGPVALVIGDEGEGVSRLALEKCDGRVAIPIKGEIESLNASVAAGILLYEIIRQRDAT